MSVGLVTGWLALLCVACAGALPLGHALLRRARMQPGARWPKLHVWLGLATSALAFFHVIAAIPSLNEPAVVAAGMLSLAPGVLAFFGLVAHTGVGLQLRKPKLRDRTSKRRTHVLTASVIVLSVLAHLLALRFSA